MPIEIGAALVGVAGTLVGVWYGAKLSSSTAKNLMVQLAKSEFSAAFTDTLVQLHSAVEDPGEGETLTIMRENFPTHLAAYLKLRAAVPSEHLDAIDAAWDNYTKDNEYELKEEKNIYRFALVLRGENDEQMRVIAIKHINALTKAMGKT